MLLLEVKLPGFVDMSTILQGNLTKDSMKKAPAAIYSFSVEEQNSKRHALSVHADSRREMLLLFDRSRALV